MWILNREALWHGKKTLICTRATQEYSAVRTKNELSLKVLLKNPPKQKASSNSS